MFINTYLDDIVAWAPAKVNLFLEVLAKRPDGYHEIATLMVAVRLFDTLVFREASDLTLQCYDKKLSSGDDNLVLKAAKLLQTRSQTKKGASIRLVKRIPMAAGLAGGSTDAAATLAGLDRLWQVGKSAGELAALSSEIGSDIPFFFRTPAAWCTGRGEIVTAVNLPIPLHFVLLCPSFGMATAAVYKNVVIPPQPVTGNEIRDALAKGDVDLLGRFMHNRLQLAAEKIDSRIGKYLAMLTRLKPAGCMMSGSGSTLFALCRSPEDAQRIAAELKTQTKGHEVKILVTRSL
jgi:4-diphosphocytidyl-2-C-methyl-D-erythritol kinase